MTKHTPGPWWPKPQDDQVIYETPDREGWTVVAEAGYTRTTEEERFANLLLIAAAPDLLAACEAALATLEHHYSSLYSNPGGEVRIYTQLRDAIAKARRTL